MLQFRSYLYDTVHYCPNASLTDMIQSTTAHYQATNTKTHVCRITSSADMIQSTTPLIQDLLIQ